MRITFDLQTNKGGILYAGNVYELKGATSIIDVVNDAKLWLKGLNTGELSIVNVETLLTWTELYNELLNNGEISADNIDFDTTDFGWELIELKDKEFYREVK